MSRSKFARRSSTCALLLTKSLLGCGSGENAPVQQEDPNSPKCLISLSFDYPRPFADTCGNNLVMNYGTTETGGMSGEARRFNGDGSYINIKNDKQMSLNSGTVRVKIDLYAEKYPAENSNGQPRIYPMGVQMGRDSNSWALGFDSYGRAVFAKFSKCNGESPETIESPEGSVPKNELTHLEGSYSAVTDTMELKVGNNNYLSKKPKEKGICSNTSADVLLGTVDQEAEDQFKGWIDNFVVETSPE